MSYEPASFPFDTPCQRKGYRFFLAFLMMADGMRWGEGGAFTLMMLALLAIGLVFWIFVVGWEPLSLLVWGMWGLLVHWFGQASPLFYLALAVLITDSGLRWKGHPQAVRPWRDTPASLRIGCWLLLCVGFGYQNVAEAWTGGSWHIWRWQNLIWILAGWTLVQLLRFGGQPRLWIWCCWLGVAMIFLGLKGEISSIVLLGYIFDRRWMKPGHVNEKAVVFFDGVCGLCNRAIDLLLQESMDQNLQYAPLQGVTAGKWGVDAASSTIVVRKADGSTLTKAEAVFFIAESMGGMFGFLKGARLLPRCLSDGLYDWIARNRLEIFGQLGQCRIPSPQEKHKLLP